MRWEDERTQPEIRFPDLETWHRWHNETTDPFRTSHVTKEMPAYEDRSET